ncbi:MAG TPA: uracil-DNA glycosylase [Nitrolancea sp.]|nr:uracil-DNA glycosylase [Nitrolancea sp.]
MASSRPILGPTNGPVPAEVMLIGEAPGRLGAARTGVPFSGDQSARNLARLLNAAGWTRDDVFLTNAVLCHPRTETGGNRRPDRSEVRRCSGWLREQIAIVDPVVVGALGIVALDALALIEPHNGELRRDAGKAIPWNGRLLVPLYHPSPRAQIHRPLAAQEADFRSLRQVWEASGRWEHPG